MSAGDVESDVYLISIPPLPPTAASADPIDPNAEINADPTSDPTSTGPSAANANAVCRNNVCNSKHDA